MKNSVFLPKKGAPRSDTLKTLESLHNQDSNWHDGRTWSLVYHAGDEHTEFLKKAYAIYFHQNGLNPGAFPSLRKYEAEVISITAQLFNGGDDACGTMTSGGSESIMMAVKTCRDWARVTKSEIQKPEMIVPASIHPAFDKAAHYFNVKMHKAPLGPDYRVDLKAVESLTNQNTIMIVGSAPQYPQGVIDPIEELAKFAQSREIWMHVDACVGGFKLPFLEKLGEKIALWDFRVSGVTSISADLHKYGFAAKGASVVMYRNRDIRKHQFFVSSDWSGGAFASPSMTGTRPAGSIAAAWATLQTFGEDGYLKLHSEIRETVQKLQKSLKEMGFEILGKPTGHIFAFTHPSVDIYAIADQMGLKGWHIDRQQKPNSIHLMVTPAHHLIVPQFLSDIKLAIETVKQHPELAKEGMAAMYGMIAQVPDPTMVHQYLYQYMEDRYNTDQKL